MKGRLINLVTAFCVILFGMVLLFWIRSYAGVDAVVHYSGIHTVPFDGPHMGSGVYLDATTTAVCSLRGRVSVFRFWDSVGQLNRVPRSPVTETNPAIELWSGERPSADGFPDSPALRGRYLTTGVPPEFSRWGFEFDRSSSIATRDSDEVPFIHLGSSTTSSLTLKIPFWSFALAAALLPGLCLGARLYAFQRRSANPDVCARCGYDLRATPSRCPECGTTASVNNSG